MTETITLGVQTNPFIGLIEREAFWKCQVWAKDYRAKSFSYTFEHTDYHGQPSDNVTGYATITVTYYGRENDGDHMVRSAADTLRFKKESDEIGFRLFTNARAIGLI